VLVGGDDAGAYGPNAVAVDDVSLYFADTYNNAIFKVAKDPATSTVVQDVAKTDSSYYQLWRVATDGQYVYFTDTGDGISNTAEGDVWQCPVSGCGGKNESRKKLFGGLGTRPYDVLVVGKQLFFSSDLDTKGFVRRCEVPDCAQGATLFAQNQDAAELLAADEAGNNIFWTVGNGDVGVRSCPATASALCAPTDLVTGETGLFGIAARTTGVWASKFDGHLGKIVSKTSGAPTTFASGQVWPMYMVTDAKSVYWTARTDNKDDPSANVNGKVFRCPLSGCASGPELLFTATGDLRGIAHDDRAIYFASYSSGKIYKLAK
jgi:hypothetical protein